MPRGSRQAPVDPVPEDDGPPAWFTAVPADAVLPGLVPDWAGAPFPAGSWPMPPPLAAYTASPEPADAGPAAVDAPGRDVSAWNPSAPAAGAPWGWVAQGPGAALPGFGPPQPYNPAAYGAAPYTPAAYGAAPYNPAAYGAGGWGPPDPGLVGSGVAPWGWVPTAYKRNGLALASMLCAIFGVVSYGTGFPVAIVLGHLARRQLRRDPRPGAGFARAGLIIGYIGLAVTVAAIVLFIIYAHHGSSGSGGDSSNQNVLFLH